MPLPILLSSRDQVCVLAGALWLPCVKGAGEHVLVVTWWPAVIRDWTW